MYHTSSKNAGCSVSGNTGRYGGIGCNTIEAQRQTEGVDISVKLIQKCALLGSARIFTNILYM